MRALVLALVLMAGLVRSAAAQNHPELEWQVVESEGHQRLQESTHRSRRCIQPVSRVRL